MSDPVTDQGTDPLFDASYMKREQTDPEFSRRRSKREKEIDRIHEELAPFLPCSGSCELPRPVIEGQILEQNIRTPGGYFLFSAGWFLAVRDPDTGGLRWRVVG